VIALCTQENVRSPNIVERLLNSYDGDDPTDLQRLSAPGSAHYPDPITEVPLNDERSDRSQDGDVYGGKMRVREAFYVAKSSNKPIVDIGPGEHSLNGLQDENEISCSESTLITELTSNAEDPPRNFTDRESSGKL
jgi:hypothetical protein